MLKELPDNIKMLMQLHYSRLSEKNRRHYAALESLKSGRGGITSISEILGVDRKTIRQGRKELKSEAKGAAISKDRQRRAGGGRKKNRKIS